jgi:alkylresorcinol/alkylpyrone synthase
MLPVSVLGLATAVPPFVVDQQEVARRAGEVFGPTFERFPGLIEVFAHTGIERRYSVRPVDWFETPQGWPERNTAYLDGACALFAKAATAALARAGMRASDIDVIVTVSSTGIATPSLEARLAKQLGFRPDAARIPVFGLGCAGGVTGLSLAARLARAAPGQIVLFVTVELCTLAFRRDRIDKADVVATALFGDGAAAAVLQAGSDRAGVARIGAAFEHTWPETLDIMGWSIDPAGFGVILSPALPRFVETHFGAAARDFLDSAGLRRNGLSFVCHPGGAKVLAAVEPALGLAPGALATERSVLRDYGNMSAPTVLFVLERALSAGLSGPAALSALGPGFTASFLALEVGHG